jgi:transcriptional regulator with XRE-family HTH domain
MIAVTLKEWRAARGLSLGSLAIRSGVHKSTLSRWESGKSVPFAQELENVLAVLAVPDELQRSIWKSLGVPRAARKLAIPSSSESTIVSGGSLLRALRLRAGRTQADVARAVGVSQSTVFQWERNDSWPSDAHLWQLCDALGARPGERCALSRREWTKLADLPRDRDALDAKLELLRLQDSHQDRSLSYIALASQYWELYRGNRISEIDYLDVWGFHSDHLLRLGYSEDAEQIAQRSWDTISSTRGAISRGQFNAFTVVVDINLTGSPKKLELLQSLEPRIPPILRSHWLDSVAMAAWHLKRHRLFDHCSKASADEATSLADYRHRCQRYARLLCWHNRFEEALVELEKSADGPTDPRTYVAVERELIAGWALAATGAKVAGARQLDRVKRLLEANPAYYERDDQIGMAKIVEERLAA